MEDKATFVLWDYVVFVAMLVISAAIGIYCRFTGGKQKTVEEYLLADRNMSILPVAFSLMASFMSAVTLLGLASENYIFGTQFVMINVAYVFATPIATFLFLPVFYRMQAASAYTYLERRFGRPTLLVASISFQLQMVLYMGVVLYAPSLALNAVTGIPKWLSVASVGLVCTFYSTIGGIKAVLWTDLFQSLLMFASIFAILFGNDRGGLAAILKDASEGGRLEFFRFDVDPTARYTFWTQTIGGIFTFSVVYCVNQAQIQRLLTLKSLRRAQISLYLSWPILSFLSLTTSLCGLVIYSAYRFCDPFASKRIVSSDQLLPVYVMDHLSYYPGVAGLFVSGIFSATLSTVSSCVNSLAAVTLEDYVKPWLRPQLMSDKKQALLSKVLVLCFGLICLFMAFLAEHLGGLLQAALTVFGVVGGPLLGLFSLGMFCTKTNQKGALVGVLVGLAVCCWLGFGATIHKPYIPKLPTSVEGCSSLSPRNTTRVLDILSSVAASDAFNASTSQNSSNFFATPNPMTRNDDVFYPYRISYMWVGPIGFLITMLIGLLVSFCTGFAKQVHPDLISPPFQALYGLKKASQTEEDLAVGKTDWNDKLILDGSPELFITKL